ncbi:hypothetical protein J3Q64DRAFT_1199154 [Phycomyces blakesleeanus]|uniref:Uncharacterized protein n=2 Tax=Phycomyces blakesleeanus TaxID=4837 RepID=A0A162WNS9_PHYB8|nr:hypothetical protein PHYBLDRAFT_66687 [Phycomyces blakesleeanus NRRL 1555(-)]OAD69345.1 hypothetical protein PHYBLDRAFT_66687 [Phycomyces blakesleeanus NRRL 1555(-)]|eukprot:XP_018287385.1 hypothetical protein PHYBLDRAFT_66687 [Phycomyces blakesleeanus NRRL 1555(-)]
MTCFARSTLALRRQFTSKASLRITDKDGLPLSATWSVRSLLENDHQTMSDEQFKSLFRLAQLRAPSSADAFEKLKKDVNQLSAFVGPIQRHEYGTIKPLSHIWQERIGMELRQDKPKNDPEEVRGRALLKEAKQISGHFYMVRGSLPSSDS